LGDSGIRDATTYLRGDNTWASVSAGGSDSFSTIAVAGQTSVVADSATDTLTLVAGSGITITTVAGTDTITITSTASGGASAFDDLTDAVSASLTIDRIYLPAITLLEVTANGTSAYRFDQYGTADDPTIYAINGTTIAFHLAGASGHPFLIQDGTGVNYDTGLVHVSTTGVVSTGSAAQAKTSGTLYWKIPSSISGGYRYQCQSHLGMVGTITVKNFVAL
jgi:plastocyanin